MGETHFVTAEEVAVPRFQAADYGCEIEDLTDSRGKGLFRKVTMTWSPARPWKGAEATPITKEEQGEGFLYALTRSTGRSKLKERIVYIGLTTNPKARFRYHHAADSLFSKGVSVALSVGRPNFGRYRKEILNFKGSLEELEHIYIWTAWEYLINKNKIWTVPGQGTNGGKAWHIKNEGNTFLGQMPEEVVFPWLLLRPQDGRRKEPAGNG